MTYTYKCEACGAVCTAQQRITAPALEDCPKCTKPALRRLITNGNFILNGSGWEKKGGY